MGEFDQTALKTTSLALGNNARVIARGFEAVIVEDGDSIVKMFLNRANRCERSLQNAEAENRTLDLLEQYGFAPCEIPKKIEFIKFSSPVQCGADSFVAAIRMTKLSGSQPDFQSLDEDFYRQCGRMIGKLHANAEAIPPSKLYEFENITTSFFAALEKHEIRSIPKNEIDVLKELHLKFKTATAPIVLLHTDAAPNNILVNEQNEITGLVDWSNTAVGRREDDFFHYGTNFINLPLAPDARLSCVLDGYKTETGIELNKDAVKLSIMTTLADYILHNEVAGEDMRAPFNKSLIASFKEMISAYMPATLKDGPKIKIHRGMNK
ncbi:MAG: aminoglycoside phosphotransferase family protein [Micavibrio sp.]|nr:aminoglycoside phosphotransferase family protein [Micavibrio sp.]